MKTAFVQLTEVVGQRPLSLYLPDPDVFVHHLLTDLLLAPGAVQLQPNVAAAGTIITVVADFDAIDISLEVITFRFYPHVVPLAGFKSFATFFIFSHRLQPAATAFLVKAAGPGPIRGINLHLIAVELTGFPVAGAFFQLTGKVWRGGIFFVRSASDLYARINGAVNFEIQLQHKVVVSFVGDQESIGQPFFGDADDGFVFNVKLGSPSSSYQPLKSSPLNSIVHSSPEVSAAVASSDIVSLFSCCPDWQAVKKTAVRLRIVRVLKEFVRFIRVVFFVC
jgi:hypothetical protein